MSRPTIGPKHRFILQALDPVTGHPLIEALLELERLDDLRALLGARAKGDPQLRRLYYPDEGDLRAIQKLFGLRFDSPKRLTRLHNLILRGRLPYLPHSGQELPLLLDGSKQMGYQEHIYPPRRHPGENLYDLQVAAGRLYKEVFIEPFDDRQPRHQRATAEGYRRVWYTRIGQEWRIPAAKMLWQTKQPWDATSERLWSMLFGYEDWQTEYWIAHNRERSGAWSGIPIYCSVSEARLHAIEAVGFRALPPIGEAPLIFSLSDERPVGRDAAAMMAPEAVALARATIGGLLLLDLKRGQDGPFYSVCAERLAELNRALIGTIELVALTSGS